MNDILSEIYRNDFYPMERPYRPNPEMSKAYAVLEKLEAEMLSALSPELKEKFMAFDDAYAKLRFIAGEEDFITGYRLGVRLMLAALTDVQ